MTVDQALQMAASLTEAARKAVQSGATVIDLTASLQSADDDAREELASAIASARERMGV